MPTRFWCWKPDASLSVVTTRPSWRLRVFTLGWCTAINIVLLGLTTLALILMKDFTARVHSALFGLNRMVLAEQYFQYLAQYKILVVVFNLVPYVALRLI